MKIKMNETVEDSHKYVVDVDDNPEIKYDVRKFNGGQSYDESNGGPDFDRRAKRFIKDGYAKAA